MYRKGRRSKESTQVIPPSKQQVLIPHIPVTVPHAVGPSIKGDILDLRVYNLMRAQQKWEYGSHRKGNKNKDCSHDEESDSTL